MYKPINFIVMDFKYFQKCRSSADSEKMYKEVYDLFADQTRTILFDARLNVGYEVYLARVARPLEESWPAWNPRDFGELELRVV